MAPRPHPRRRTAWSTSSRRRPRGAAADLRDEGLRASGGAPGSRRRGSLIPLVPFLVLARAPAVWTAIAVSAAALFFVGAYEAKTSIGDWRKKGLEMAAIGVGAAFVGDFGGKIFHATG